MSNYFNKVVMGVLTLLLPFASLLFVACSEEDDTQEEYPNWQETNETYFNKLYAEANKRIAAGDKSWKVIPKWSLQDTLHLDADDYIIAHVVNEGSGTETPRTLPGTSASVDILSCRTCLRPDLAQRVQPEDDDSFEDGSQPNCQGCHPKRSDYLPDLLEHRRIHHCADADARG